MTARPGTLDHQAWCDRGFRDRPTALPVYLRAGLAPAGPSIAAGYSSTLDLGEFFFFAALLRHMLQKGRTPCRASGPVSLGRVVGGRVAAKHVEYSPYGDRRISTTSLEGNYASD